VIEIGNVEGDDERFLKLRIESYDCVNWTPVDESKEERAR
jgi:hypothetical protein